MIDFHFHLWTVLEQNAFKNHWLWSYQPTNYMFFLNIKWPVLLPSAPLSSAYCLAVASPTDVPVAKPWMSRPRSFHLMKKHVSFLEAGWMCPEIQYPKLLFIRSRLDGWHYQHQYPKLLSFPQPSAKVFCALSWVFISQKYGFTNEFLKLSLKPHNSLPFFLPPQTFFGFFGVFESSF